MPKPQRQLQKLIQIKEFCRTLRGFSGNKGVCEAEPDRNPRGSAFGGGV
jgi:hypothetical protein